MNDITKTNEILLTKDILERYKISRSTLYFWSTPDRKPKFLSKPFPKPTIKGNPNRWWLSDILEWERNNAQVNGASTNPSR
ncbi:TPA: helix-turn-helix transcriptional regulator [Escherichia coli]